MKHLRTFRIFIILMVSLLATAPASAAKDTFHVSALASLALKLPVALISNADINNYQHRLAALTLLNGIIMAGYIFRDGAQNNISRSESRGKIARAKDGALAMINPKNYGRKMREISRIFSPEAVRSPEMIQPKFTARAKEFMSQNPLFALSATLFVVNAGYSGFKGGKYLLNTNNSDNSAPAPAPVAVAVEEAQRTPLLIAAAHPTPATQLMIQLPQLPLSPPDAANSLTPAPKLPPLPVSPPVLPTTPPARITNEIPALNLGAPAARQNVPTGSPSNPTSFFQRKKGALKPTPAFNTQEKPRVPTVGRRQKNLVTTVHLERKKRGPVQPNVNGSGNDSE